MNQKDDSSFWGYVFLQNGGVGWKASAGILASVFWRIGSI